MNEEMTQQLAATAERLATAAETLDRVLGKLDAQQEALNAKVDRIVAAVEEGLAERKVRRQRLRTNCRSGLRSWRKRNTELKAQAARMARKTLPPLVTALLARTGTRGRKAGCGRRWTRPCKG